MRSLLFVPADSAKKLDKGMTGGADAVIVDQKTRLRSTKLAGSGALVGLLEVCRAVHDEHGRGGERGRYSGGAGLGRRLGSERCRRSNCSSQTSRREPSVPPCCTCSRQNLAPNRHDTMSALWSLTEGKMG